MKVALQKYVTGQETGIQEGALTAAFIQHLVRRHGRLLHDVVSLVTIQAAVAGLGFLTRVGLANAMGAEEFGVLSLALAVGLYGQTAVDFGLGQSLVRDVAHFPDRVGELLAASLLLRFVLFTAVLTLIALCVLFMPQSSLLGWDAFPALIAIVLGGFYIQGYYDARGEMRRHAVYFMIEKLVYSGFVWFAILSPLISPSLPNVGIFMLMGVGVGLLLQYRRAWTHTKISDIGWLRKSLGLLLRSNVWICMATSASLCIGYFNQIVLGCCEGTAEVGRFSAAWLLISVVSLAIGQISRVGAGATGRYTRVGTTASAQRGFFLRYLFLMSFLGVAAGLPLVLFPERVLMLFGPDYASAATALRVLGFYPMLYAPYVATMQYVIASRLERTYFALISIAGVLSIASCFWLIPVMQGIGAAISAVASLGVALVLFLGAASAQLRRVQRSELS